MKHINKIQTDCVKRNLSKITACCAIGLSALFAGHSALAQTAANADASYNGFLSTYLKQANGQTYFDFGTANTSSSYMWNQGMEIGVVETYYDRTQNPATKTLITNLLNTFMANNNGSDWSWDSWNDDIGWADMAFIRGYQITGNSAFLTAAANNWNMTWNRGWDTTVGGGIWENQDKQTKTTLANATMIIAGMDLYQATGDYSYVTRCQQIYSWMRGALFNASTGQINEALTSSGALQASDNMYNSGIFLNAANALYKATASIGYYNDALVTANHVTASNLWYFKNGIVAYNTGPNGFWSDQFNWALGLFARQNNLWSTYSPWFQRQATASWNTRNTNGNISDEDWTTTPTSSNYWTLECMGSVVLQQEAATDPRSGPHVIFNVQNGLVIDNGSSTQQNYGIMQWQWNGGSQQRWIFTQNADTTWNIANAYSGMSLDSPGSTKTNGTQLIQWPYNGGQNQEWWVELQSDGTYQIQNVFNSLVLDNDSKSVNGTPLIEWAPQGQTNQRWILK